MKKNIYITLTCLLLAMCGSDGRDGENGKPGTTGAAGPQGSQGIAGQDAVGVSSSSFPDAVAVGVATYFPVNQATTSQVLDEGDSSLRLMAPATAANTVGGFNGSGVGNKAIVGLSGFGSVKLLNFLSLTLSYKKVVTGQVYANFQLDAECDGVYDKNVNDRIWAPAAFANADFWTSMVIDRNTSGSLFPGGASSTLNAFLTSFPNACFFDGFTNDNGLPFGASTSAILLVGGDSATLTAYDTLVDNVIVKLGGRTISETLFGF